MNRTYCAVWSEARQDYIVAPETARAAGKKKSAVALGAGLLCIFGAGATAAGAADLPAGGNIVAGSGNIAASGTTLTVNQATAKMAIDWQSFSIGHGNTVSFVQPDSSAVVLNRVLGTDVSLIQGALRANGQVFLVNPNGVVFTPSAQVNVGGLVASTLNLGTNDFINGSYRFEGTGSNAVINQGNITAATGGSVALIAAKIVNTGQISAERGNVLVGAGSKVRLDLGGPVKIEVEQGALDALIEQGGAIRANGGLVYLTAKAAGELSATVINHTGLTEAKTLATGEKGEIRLLGGMDKDRIAVGGKLDASAPAGGDGGFIETSAAHVNFASDVNITTAAASGKTGQWLIDPVDFKVASTGGNITGSALGTLLNNNSVTIQTSAGTNTSTNLYSASSGNGDIIVSDVVTKSSGTATTLTLAADRDIVIDTTASISGSAGSPLNLVLAARANGGATGTVNVRGVIRTYGGDVTIGGGDIAASGYAVAGTASNPGKYYATGVDILAMVDTTADGSGVANATLPTAAAGGNITLRGKGNDTSSGAYNWGVHLDNFATRNPVPTYGALVAGGSGSISITGYGGNGTGSYAVGSVGVVLEGTVYVKSNAGNITVRGYKGTGVDQYGLATTPSLIATNGWLSFDGDSWLLRSGTMTIYTGQDSDIKMPIVGCTYGFYCSSTPTFVKQGSGILNLSGNAEAWNANRPANTVASIQGTGTFTDASNTVNVVGITAGQALYAFGTRPTTVTTVSQSSSAASITTLTYTLADVGFGTAVSYKGSGYLLGDYWSATAIFGNAGSGLVLGTDYSFLYNGSTVTSFTNAGTYSGITVSLNKANYALATTGNTSGSFKITPKALSITAPTIASKTYDGSQAAGTLTLGALSGFAGSETVTVSGTAAALAGKDVGSYTTTVSYTLANGSNGELASNYSLASSSGVSAAITAKQLTISGLAASNKTYDGTVSASISNWGSVSTGVGSETLALNHGTASFDTANAGTGKTVTATGYSLANGSGGLAANYQLTSTSATTTASVDKASLTVSVGNVTKTYDGGTTASGTATVVSGTLYANGSNGNAQDSLSGGSFAFADRNAGTGKTVTVSGVTVNDGNSGGNYQLSFVDNTSSTINKAALGIAADNKTKTYGNADPTLTWQVTSGSLVNNDTLSGALTRSAGENAGSYTIDASALSNGNYVVTATNGSLTINPRPITVAADSKTKDYGSADPLLTWRLTSGSLVNSDSLAGALTRAPGEAAGTYVIDASQLANGNYLITANNGTLTINNNAGVSAAIANVQSQVTPTAAIAKLGTVVPTVAASGDGPARTGSGTAVPQSGGLIMVQGEEPAADRATTGTPAATQPASAAGLDASGFMRVFVVRGGINADFGQKKNN